MQLGLGLRLRLRRGRTRRVWVPLWYCAISRPVVSTYGKVGVGRLGRLAVLHPDEAGPAVGGREAVGEQPRRPGMIDIGHGQNTPCSASIRS